jgi:hypothetical protein
MFDVCSKESYSKVQGYLDALKRIIADDVPICLLANKVSSQM